MHLTLDVLIYTRPKLAGIFREHWNRISLLSQSFRLNVERTCFGHNVTVTVPVLDSFWIEHPMKDSVLHSLHQIRDEPSPIGYACNRRTTQLSTIVADSESR